QPVPPLEVKAYWNKPKVAISNECVELSAEVKGGAHQIATGRILTIDGEVSAKQGITSDADANGRPYACVKAINPLQLHMRNLKVTYEGSKWPAFLEKLNPAKEETLLRPVLTAQLIG